MNITEYKVNGNEFQIYHGTADIVDVTFGIYNADESFYRFVGKKSGFSIPDLLHPEDVPGFRDAIAHIDEGPQNLVVRFLNDADKYCCVYMKIVNEGTFMKGERFFSIEITDIMAITERYKEREEIIEKYRKYMSLCDGVFVEYNYADTRLQVYEYFNGQCRPMFDKKLEDAKSHILASEHLSASQKDDFVAFAEMVSKKIDGFKFTLDAQIFVEYMEGVQWECSCAAVYKDDMHHKMVGLCKQSGASLTEQPYYMSEYAIDAATGVLNKKAIQEYTLESIVRGNLRYFVILDIDNFKQVNDRYGHMYGDEVIAKCAEIFKSVIQNRGAVGRFGGDEFVFALEKVESEEELRRIMKVIAKHAMWAYWELDEMNITFSSGIAQMNVDGTTYEELMQKADKCLYIAKAKGKNRYIIYREELHGAVETTGKTNRTVGLNAAISDADKHILLSDMVLQLHRGRKAEIEPVMEKVQSYYDIDAISIYIGNDMRRAYSRGEYVNSIECFASVLKPDYQEFFDKDDFYNGELMQRIEKRCPEVEEFNKQQEISKSVQCLYKKEGVVQALVSFDFFNRSPKIGCLDNGMMLTIGRLMAEIAIES